MLLRPEVGCRKHAQAAELYRPEVLTDPASDFAMRRERMDGSLIHGSP